MTPKEFNEWFECHTAMFTDVETWLADNGDGQDGVDTLIAWQEELKDVRLKDAKQASKAMFGGQHTTTGYSDHPAAVNRWCRHLSDTNYSRGPKSLYGEAVYSCHLCLDSGTRLVFHPLAVRAVRIWPLGTDVTRDRDPDDDQKMKSLRNKLRLTCNVACTCNQGDRWASPTPSGKGKTQRPLPRFTDVTWVPISGSSPNEEEVGELVKHVEAAEAERFGRHSEFDDFNNT